MISAALPDAIRLMTTLASRTKTDSRLAWKLEEVIYVAFEIAQEFSDGYSV